MLDLEVISGPDKVGTDVVSWDDLKKHLRYTNDSLMDQGEDAINDAMAILDGPNGILNRTVLPRRYVRYLPEFPESRVIALPFPPLKRVLGIWYEDADGSSPSLQIDPSWYVVRNPMDGAGVAEIELLAANDWPATLEHARAVSVIFDAGYDDFAKQGDASMIRRLVKILAGHFMENPEATVNDRRQSMVSRKVEYGVDYLVDRLRISPAQDNWE